MLKRYREIRNRYADVARGSGNPQMFRDIQTLLRYVDLLHEGLARRAAENLVNEAFETFDGETGRHSLTH